MADFEKTYPIRLMIVGAQKAGTTSLLRYLSEHPGICTHEQLEMPYFVRDSIYQQGYAALFPRYFSCNISRKPIIMAKSVAIMLLPEAIHRLYDHNSHTHLVVILRNPVDRAHSHYWYSRRRGWEDLNSFEDALEIDPKSLADEPLGKINCAYLDNGIYIRHLNQLLRYFDRDQIHIVLLKDLKENPVAVCQELFGYFRELDNSFVPDANRSHNASAAYHSRSLALLTSSRTTLPVAKRLIRLVLPDRVVDNLRDFIRTTNEQDIKPQPMKPETRSRLLDYFRPYNEQLSEAIDRDLDHWDN